MPILIPQKIIIHHAAEIDSPGLDWSGIRKYQMSYRVNYHIVTKEEFIRLKATGVPGHYEEPFIDIGYHAGVELIGTSYEVLMGRPWTMAGAHMIGQKQVALGLCFVGNFNLIEPPKDQIITGARVVSMWMKIYKIPMSEIYPHYRFESTDCPGQKFDMGKFVDAIRLA